jgi:shikimate kinase
LSRPAVVLVGIPASGKTSVGQLIADALGLPLIDTDVVVADQLGATATESFADDAGTAEFRAAEEAAALHALTCDGVLALGSGAVTSSAVRAALSDQRVYWLRTSVAATTRRLGMTRLGMEVLVAIRNKLDAQLAERAGWYEDVATSVIDTDRLGAEQIAARILAELEAR